MANFSPVPRRMNYGRPSDIKFGPWTAGLSTKFTPEILDNAALAECTNFDVLESGELKVRPGFRYDPDVDNAFTGYDPLASQTDYVAGSNGGTGLFIFQPSTLTAYFGNHVGGVSCSWATFYRNKVYYGGIIPSSGTGKITTFDIATSAFNTVNTGPVLVGAAGFGRSALIFRDRAFLTTNITGSTASHRVYYSKATDPSDFTSIDAGFFDMPDNVTALAATRTTLYIFCSNSFYSLAYSSNPSDGRIEVINPAIGCYNDGAIAYNNHIYFAGPQGAYNLINNNLSNISNMLDVDSDFVTPFLLDERILWNRNTKSIVYHLRSLRWSNYSKTITYGFPGATPNQFWAKVNGVGWCRFYGDYAQYPDTDTSSVDVPITATCRTKDYDTGIVSFDSWKRLYTVTGNLWASNTASGNIVIIVGDYNNTNDAVPLANIFPLDYNFATTPGYNTFKFHSSLRVQRWHYDVQIVDSGPSPVSLFYIASQAKVKEPSQSGSVSGSTG